VQERTTALPRYLWSWVEHYTGTNPYRRLKVSVGPSRNFVTEVVTFDYGGGGYGIRLVHTGSYGYLIAAGWVRRLKAYAGAAGEIADVSADVQRVELEEASESPGRGRIWLDNSRRQYAGAGTGALLALRVGSRVRVGLGYRTAAGIETIWQPPRWIDGLRFVERGDGESDLVLELVDAWGLLERRRAFRQEEIVGRNLSSILTRAASRLSGQYSSSLHPNLNRTVARYIVAPSQGWAEVAREMGRSGGLLLRFRTNPGVADGRGWGSVALEAVALGGTAAYTYGPGPGEHPVLAVEDGPAVQTLGHVEVFGDGALGEAWDHDNVFALGHERLVQLHDLQITTDTDAATRASCELARAQREGWTGRLEAAPNLALEVFDVVLVKDRQGNVNGPRQVSHLRTVLDRRTGEYRQVVEYWRA